MRGQYFFYSMAFIDIFNFLIPIFKKTNMQWWGIGRNIKLYEKKYKKVAQISCDYPFTFCQYMAFYSPSRLSRIYENE
jgi:hypothetical protein